MNQDWLKKNRRALIMIGIFAALILANVIIHLRRSRPTSGANSTGIQPTTTSNFQVSPPAAPTPAKIPPALSGGPTANPTGVSNPLSSSPSHPVTGLKSLPGVSGVADWSRVLSKIEELEKHVVAIPALFPAPTATAPFLVPRRDPLHWALSDAPALETQVASTPVPSVSFTATNQHLPPALIGVFRTRGKTHILIRDRNEVHALYEGETHPQAPWRLVSLQEDGAIISDSEGKEVSISSPELEEKRRLARVRQILEGQEPPPVFKLHSSTGSATSGGANLPPSPGTLSPVSPPVPVSPGGR